MTPDPSILALRGKTVKILKPPFEDGYLDAGMYADIAAIQFEPRDNYYAFTFDLSRFESYNERHDKPTWYNKANNMHDLSAKEAGMYPKNNREQSYIMANEVFQHLEVVTTYPVTIDTLNLPELPQRQDSVTDQMSDLVKVATKLGLYDAADWVRANFRGFQS